MAYDTDNLKEKALKAIEENRLIYFKDVYAHIGISHNAFYDHFPKESEDYEDIKRRLQVSKIKMKTQLRKKWYDSDTASLSISLYKLLADDEELRRLDNGKRDQQDRIEEYINKLKSDALQPLPEAETSD